MKRPLNTMSMARLKELLGLKSTGQTGGKVGYYEALFSRLQSVPGLAETKTDPPDEKTARIIEAIVIRTVFEDLRERKLPAMLSLGNKGRYHAIVAGRYSVQADAAYQALLSAFMKADKAGLFRGAAAKS